jgi:ATP-dependent Clp protease protease subunit
MPSPQHNESEDRDTGGGFLMKHLLRARAVLLSEAITDKLSRRVTAQLLALQAEDEKAPITVYVNSPGGSVDSGFAIYDMLRFVKPPVRTVVSGLCASAAVLIYLAPPKERRLSLPNGRFLLHQPSTAVMGDATDIAISAKEILALRVRYEGRRPRLLALRRGGAEVRAGREDRPDVRGDLLSWFRVRGSPSGRRRPPPACLVVPVRLRNPTSGTGHRKPRQGL